MSAVRHAVALNWAQLVMASTGRTVALSMMAATMTAAEAVKATERILLLASDVVLSLALLVGCG